MGPPQLGIDHERAPSEEGSLLAGPHAGGGLLRGAAGHGDEGGQRCRPDPSPSWRDLLQPRAAPAFGPGMTTAATPGLPVGTEAAPVPSLRPVELSSNPHPPAHATTTSHTGSLRRRAPVSIANNPGRSFWMDLAGFELSWSDHALAPADRRVEAILPSSRPTSPATDSADGPSGRKPVKSPVQGNS